VDKKAQVRAKSEKDMVRYMHCLGLSAGGVAKSEHRALKRETSQREGAERKLGLRSQGSVFDPDLRSLFAEAAHALSGRWELSSVQERIRTTDGRLEVSRRSTTLWLREDGRAQCEQSEALTTYDGTSTECEAYGGRERLYIIAERGKPSDEFLQEGHPVEHQTKQIEPLARKFWKTAAQPPGHPGTYSIKDVPGTGLELHIVGRGRGRASAWEGDDLGTAGGGAHPQLHFSVSVEELLSRYTRT